jgi:quercetin dioxygenase-like cupin family protein
MSKMGLNQIKIGNFYNSEEYFRVIPDTSKKSPIRYFFTGDNLSVSLHMIPAKMPVMGEHHHVHEQFLLVPQGDGKALIDGQVYDTEPGFFAYFPSEVPHGYITSEATYTCWNLDIFYPARLEYQKDNYYRILASGRKPAEVMITKDSKE